jgi:hypothetical protein
MHAVVDGFPLLEVLSSVEAQVLSVTRPARYLCDFHPDPAWRQAAAQAAPAVTGALQQALANPALRPALEAAAAQLDGGEGQGVLIEGWRRVAEKYLRECDR